MANLRCVLKEHTGIRAPPITLTGGFSPGGRLVDPADEHRREEQSVDADDEGEAERHQREDNADAPVPVVADREAVQHEAEYEGDAGEEEFGRFHDSSACGFRRSSA